MFIIFGWEKTIKAVESVLSAQCLHCKNNSRWSIWKETEWISLFFVKVIPFTNTFHICCDICGDSTKLSKGLASAALSPLKRTQKLHDDLIKIIEEHQFNGLSEGQVSYRKAQIEQNKDV